MGRRERIATVENLGEPISATSEGVTQGEKVGSKDASGSSVPLDAFTLLPQVPRLYPSHPPTNQYVWAIPVICRIKTDLACLHFKIII